MMLALCYYLLTKKAGGEKNGRKKNDRGRIERSNNKKFTANG